jgi:hypothetical protein
MLLWLLLLLPAAHPAGASSRHQRGAAAAQRSSLPHHPLPGVTCHTKEVQMHVKCQRRAVGTALRSYAASLS